MTTPRHSRRLSGWTVCWLTAAIGAWIAIAPALTSTNAVRAASQKFYDDDPIAREPETQDASGAVPYDNLLASSLVVNLFGVPSAPLVGVRAENINTIDEVPDSSWFTNRIYVQTVTAADLAHGPNTMAGPAPGRWSVIEAKIAEAAPEFRVRDARGEIWSISLDAKGSPNAATGAIAVACRLFWAMGYNQAESYLTSFRPEDLDVGATAIVKPRAKYERPMEMKDIAAMLARGERSPDGSYRALAARALPGKALGAFRYHGTRPDDPNDLVPHENRRELRALKVFAAWTNLVELEAQITADTLISQDGQSIIRHYLQDVGSTFGALATGPHDWYDGHEHLYERQLMKRRFMTLSFDLQPWQTTPLYEHPEIGRIESSGFDPEAWKPRTPIAPLRSARDDDTFWAALRVAAFTDDMIRAAVREGRYADPAAADRLTTILIERRDSIARTWLPKITPVNKFSLDESGVLRFENAAVRAGVAKPPANGYQATWADFDNNTSDAKPIGDAMTSPNEQFTAPAAVRARPAGAFIKVSISALDPARPAWALPVEVFFKRVAGAWRLVGLERTIGTSQP